MSLPTILTPRYTGPASHMKSKSPISLPSAPPAAQTAPFEDDNRWKLFLTTSTKVSVWDSRGCNAVFTSGSEGIVAAKRAKDGSALAIADSQVVMLHRIEEGQDKSYRLKGTQRCRHLQYDHDSRSLFFTDSLHNSVQSYSLKENRVVDAAKPHPSSITAFAISSDSNLVVSCSAEPPITQIHNRLMATTVSITPRSSTSPVVHCSFHPSRRTIFVLAFRDGVLAAYDYSKISGGSKAKKDGKVGVGQGGTKEIHAFQHLHDPSIAGSAGITGVEFVPGYRSRAATVGEDGRLFLVDFEMRDTLGSWHIGAPATSLTIRPVTVKERSPNEKDMGGCVIAIGTIHGRCYVYDGNGNKIGEQSVDSDGGKVLDVEWVSGDTHFLPSEDGGSHGPSSPRAHVKHLPSAGSQQLAENHRNSATAENPRATKEKDEASKLKLDTGEDSNQWPEAQETANQGYMTLFSPVKKKQKKPEKAISLAGTKSTDVEKISDPKLRTVEKEDQRSVISAPLLWNESAKKQNRPGSTKEDNSPIKKPVTKTNDDKVVHSSEQKPILGNTHPSLPFARSSGAGKDNPSLLTSHRITPVGSDVIKTNDKTGDGKLLSQIRSIRAKVEGDKVARGNLALFAPYMSSKIKTSALIRSGGAAENRKAPSLSQEKPVDPRLRALDGNRVDDRMDGRVDQTDKAPKAALHEEDITLPDPIESPKTDKDLPSLNQDDAESEASFDGDIWLVEDKPRTSRKRKNSNADDFQPSSSFGSSGERSSSRAGSSKSRKTVSWDDGLASQGITNSANLLHREFENSSSPQFASSGDASWPSMAKREGKHLVSNVTTPETAFTSKKISISQKDDPTSGLPSSLDETSFHTPHGLATSVMEPVSRNHLVEMQTMFKAGMEGLQAEMARSFQAQMRVLEDLRSEIQIVREENVKLRDQISELNAKDRGKHP